MKQEAPKGFRRVSDDEIEPLSLVDSQFLVASYVSDYLSDCIRKWRSK